MITDEINSAYTQTRYSNAKNRIDLIDKEKQKTAFQISELVRLNKVLSAYISDAEQNPGMTFGDWMRSKGCKIEANSNLDGLADVRSTDDDLVDSILDIGEAIDDLEEKYDLLEEKQDKLWIFLGKDTYASANGSKRQQRKQNREKRRDERKTFRSERKKLKEQKRSGKINKTQYYQQVDQKKKVKKENIKAAGGSFIQRAWGAIKKYSPITAGSRAGAIAALKLNVFGFASRLAPGFINDPKFKPQSVNKAKASWGKFKSAWVKAGGDVGKAEAAIREGYRKKPVLQKSGFDGTGIYPELPGPYEQDFNDSGDLMLIVDGMPLENGEVYSGVVAEATAGALISAGTALLTAIINRLGLDKNPFKAGEAPAGMDAALESAPTPQTPDSVPQFDPEDNGWVDEQTGERVDTSTGALTTVVPKIILWTGISLGAGLFIMGIVKLISKK